jgi:hypothetical protein
LFLAEPAALHLSVSLVTDSTSKLLGGREAGHWIKTFPKGCAI